MSRRRRMRVESYEAQYMQKGTTALGWGVLTEASLPILPKSNLKCGRPGRAGRLREP